MPFLVLKKRSIIAFVIIFSVIVSASLWFFSKSDSLSVFNQNEGEKVREIHMVTGEFKAKLPDGKEIEAYRWDPGTIFLEKNEKVNLKIWGVNGMEHPYIIEGTDIKGVVKKAEETVVPLQFNKQGVYRLVCLTHPDKDNSGPMIAYIVVD